MEFTRPYDALIAEALERHGIEPTDDRVGTYESAFFRAFEACEPAPARAGMDAVVGDAGGGSLAPDPAAMARTLREVEYAATAAAPGVDAALSALGTEHALGVLTNGHRGWQAGKLAAVGLRDRFDALVASYEAGAHKPDAAPYELARERLPAADHWMVGDDHEPDVAGARRAGFRAVHLDGGDGIRAGSLDAFASLVGL